MDPAQLLDFDRRHLWHPYASMSQPLETYPVVGARGVRIRLSDGRELIDGMASWWAAIHGYNHPVLNAAVCAQLEAMAHVMFGGLTHQPAVELAERLLGLVPSDLECVFFSDSGSVAVEVAMKMALQCWSVSGGQPSRCQFLTVRNGYHGDTLHAMSVCDPDTGMHRRLFQSAMPRQLFADAPPLGYTQPWDNSYVEGFSRLLQQHRDSLAGVILEPIVQGAGGMRIYSPQYLRQVRELTQRHNIPLILDEIATGFGRTGTMFAAEHADVVPDIMCVGKALTGGYMSLAATITTREIAERVCGDGDVLMHGPTFMANPLACRVAGASIDLLTSSTWQHDVRRIEGDLTVGLEPCREFSQVADVRTLGAIGVVELKHPIPVAQYQRAFVERGVWIRPFSNLVYVMPPYIIDAADTATLTAAIVEVLRDGSS